MIGLVIFKIYKNVAPVSTLVWRDNGDPHVVHEVGISSIVNQGLNRKLNPLPGEENLKSGTEG